MNHPTIHHWSLGCWLRHLFFNTFFCFCFGETHPSKKWTGRNFVKLLVTCLTLDNIIRSMFWPNFFPYGSCSSSSASTKLSNRLNLERTWKNFVFLKCVIHLQGQLLQYWWVNTSKISRALCMRDPTKIFLTSKFSYFTLLFQPHPSNWNADCIYVGTTNSKRWWPIITLWLANLKTWSSSQIKFNTLLSPSTNLSNADICWLFFIQF